MTTCATRPTTCAPCPTPVNTFTVDPFDLQTLLVWERNKPQHLRKYEVLWVFNITTTGTSMTMLPQGTQVSQ